MGKLKVALVHDWLTNQGGGERVLWEFHQIYPDAPIYTSVFRRDQLPQFEKLDVRTSFLQKWPMAKQKHQLYSVLRPTAFESFDFSDYDLVLSSASSEAKGIITNPGTTHICYLFTPTRYYWSGYSEYLQHPGFGLLNPLVKAIAPGMISMLREWDFAAAQRPDKIVGISKYVNQRIKKYYHRQADLIYPPVSIERFDPNQPREDYYVVVSRLIPYKRVKLAVLACTKLSLKLVVIGQGSELASLKKIAGPTVRFLGSQPDRVVADYFVRARGLIFTPEEDFGITPLEAMASGCPVIAYGRGGSLETVVEGTTGVFFNQPTVESLVEALRRFEAMEFDAKALRAQAELFSSEKFRAKFKAYIKQQLAESNN